MNIPAVSYKRHRFPPQIIAHAIWLYYRFPLSLRLVEEMLLERGIVVSYETVRRSTAIGKLLVTGSLHNFPLTAASAPERRLRRLGRESC
jgi:hypothetical protein